MLFTFIGSATLFVALAADDDDDEEDEEEDNEDEDDEEVVVVVVAAVVLEDRTLCFPFTSFPVGILNGRFSRSSDWPGFVADGGGGRGGGGA